MQAVTLGVKEVDLPWRNHVIRKQKLFNLSSSFLVLSHQHLHEKVGRRSHISSSPSSSWSKLCLKLRHLRHRSIRLFEEAHNVRWTEAISRPQYLLSETFSAFPHCTMKSHQAPSPDPRTDYSCICSSLSL